MHRDLLLSLFFSNRITLPILWNTLLMTWVVPCLQCLFRHQNSSNIQLALLMVQWETQQPLWIRHERLISYLCLILVSVAYSSFLASNLRGYSLYADGTNWAVVNEEIISCRPSWWEAMEVEEKSPPVAFTVQMEVAETLETLRVDQAQWWNNHEGKASAAGSSGCDVSPSLASIRSCISIFDSYTTPTRYSEGPKSNYR